MAVTPASFKTQFPEFSAVGDPRVQIFIDQAVRCVNATSWGARADDGVSYMAAHLLATFGDEEGASSSASISQITQKKVGEVSVSFANSSSSDSSAGILASTRYGQQFYSLEGKVFAARCLE